MVYPWSKKSKQEEEPPSEEVENIEEEKSEEKNDIIENNDKKEKSLENDKKEIEVWDNEDPRSIMLNILKLEGYKMNSGELFTAFKQASRNESEEGMMQDFKRSLEQLSELRKIKSDSDGNIMTVEEFDREKSQAKTEDEEVETSENEEVETIQNEEVETIQNEEVETIQNEEVETIENQKVETVEENLNEPENDDLDSIIKLKEETDSWLIEKLKDNGLSKENNELKKELEKIKDRVTKLENIIKNLTRAFE